MGLDLKGVVLYAGLCMCVSIPWSILSAENLISNPIVENVIESEEAMRITPEDRHSGRIRHHRLRPAKLIPLDWLPYSGGGSGEWGATDEEAFAGEYSVFLTFTGMQEFPSGLFGRMSIYSKPFEVEPETAYELSFMIKGDIQVVRITSFLWSDEDMSSGSRRWQAPTSLRKNDESVRIAPHRHALRISPGDEWARYSCVFVTRADSRMMQVSIGFLEEDQQLEPGQTFYLDDVSLTPRR